MDKTGKLSQIWLQMREEAHVNRTVFSERRYLNKVKTEFTPSEWNIAAPYIDRKIANVPHHLKPGWDAARDTPTVKAWLFARYEYMFGKLICPHCGSDDGPIFRKAKNQGFRFSALPNYCSASCSKASALACARREATCLALYGVPNISKSSKFKSFISDMHKNTTPEEFKERKFKADQTKIALHGSLEEATRKKNEKFRATCRVLYGGDSPMCSPDVQAKNIETNLRKRGVPNVSQDPEVMEKIVANTTWKRYMAKELSINGTNYTTLQGYEPDFLKWFYDVKNGTQDLMSHGLSIPYRYKGKNKYYHVDFHVAGEKTIVEVKSDYTANLDKAKMPGVGSAAAMRAKFKAAVNQGYKVYLAIWFPDLNDCFMMQGLLPSQAVLAKEVAQWKTNRLQLQAV